MILIVDYTDMLQTLIVTGGGEAGVGTRLTSTEVFEYNTGSSSGAWREVEGLPAERYSKAQTYSLYQAI